ncbi:MAG: hypothetical protein ABIO70_12185 [Pseudomonadota bacterium]
MLTNDDRLDLLRATLQRAVTRIPWYQERAAQYAVPMDSLADLARLPFVRPRDFFDDPAAFAVGEGWPDVISYSSSTTGAIGRARWHSVAEAEACAALAVGGAVAGDTLVIHPFDQASVLRSGSETGRLYVPMLLPWHFEKIHALLRDGWRGPGGQVHRFTELDCFSPGLRILTSWLQARGADPREFGIELLTGYGSIQPGPWRRLLEDTWGARYRDIYGLSEVKLGDAVSCPLCGAYHFNRPIIAEVVDPDSQQPVVEGPGILVLTELYPYAQLQTLLRYWTDDLVKIAEPCLLHPPGLRFLGRLQDSVLLRRPGRSIAVGALQVAELCAEWPDVRLAPVAWAPWAHDVGAPRCRLSLEGDELCLAAELRYLPHLFPARAAQVRAALRTALLERVPGLADAVADGAISLRVEACAPETLDAAKV